MAEAPIKTIIFDIGDVLCSWAPPRTPTVGPKLFKEFYNSHTWYEYDCGKISEDECFARLAAQGGVSAADVAAAFAMARNSLEQNDGVVAAIRELRAAHPSLCVYAMSNISRPDWEFLRRKPFGWDVFDRIFTSCEAGMRKPELRFYHHVLKEAETVPHETVFVDDQTDNVVAAQSLGFRETILFDDAANVRRKLLNLLDNPVQRGREWMSGNAEKVCSETERGDVIHDNFSQLLTYEVMKDISLLNLRHFDRTWNYFAAPSGGSQATFDDVDTTSYAFNVLPLERSVAHSIMDDMISSEQLTADGIVKVYFDKPNNRTDPAVCVNVVRMYYKFGRGNESALQPTKDWIQNVLFFRGYTNGTRYYSQPDVYLYFFARLLVDNPKSDMSRNTAALLRERLKERVNIPADSLGLAMRVLACHYMGIHDEMDLRRLLSMQQEDGSFGLGWLCNYGTTQLKVGNRMLTTALAVAAVEALAGSGWMTKQRTEHDNVKAVQQSGTRILVQYDNMISV